MLGPGGVSAGCAEGAGEGPLSFLQPPLEQERQALQNTALSWLDVATETEHSEIDFGHRSNLAAMALSNEEVWMLQRLSACLHEADMQLMQADQSFSPESDPLPI